MKKKFFCIKIKTLSVIAPDVLLLQKISNAIRIIKKIDHNEYEKLFSRLNLIFITHRSGGTNEFFMPEKIWFANKSVVVKNDLIWLASLIIHEAFHATQFKNGKYVVPRGMDIEIPALRIQESFLKKAEDSTNGSRDIQSVVNNKYWKEMDDDERSFLYFRHLLHCLNKNELIVQKIPLRALNINQR